MFLARPQPKQQHFISASAIRLVRWPVAGGRRPVSVIRSWMGYQGWSPWRTWINIWFKCCTNCHHALAPSQEEPHHSVSIIEACSFSFCNFSFFNSASESERPLSVGNMKIRTQEENQIATGSSVRLRQCLTEARCWMEGPAAWQWKHGKLGRRNPILSIFQPANGFFFQPKQWAPTILERAARSASAGLAAKSCDRSSAL